MTTAIVHHPVFREHDTGPGHPENPSRYSVVMDALRGDTELWSGLREVEELSGIVVVSADRGAKEMARTHGARAIDDPVENGPNEAVRLALPFLRDMQADAMVVVPSDVPQIEPDELLPIIAKLQSPSVALVAAARDRGTNLFGCAPIDLIAPCFGPSSFAEHENAAKACGGKGERIRVSLIDE